MSIQWQICVWKCLLHILHFDSSQFSPKSWIFQWYVISQISQSKSCEICSTLVVSYTLCENGLKECIHIPNTGCWMQYPSICGFWRIIAASLHLGFQSWQGFFFNATMVNRIMVDWYLNMNSCFNQKHYLVYFKGN